MSIELGKYKHFKGNYYEVLGIVRHSESQEELVLYKQLYGDESLWVRPLELFTEKVEVNGIQINRFQKMI